MTYQTEVKFDNSNPKVTRPSCGQFMNKERSRYERKGYGLIFAALLAYSFFYFVPKLGQLYWEDLISLKTYY